MTEYLTIEQAANRAIDHDCHYYATKHYFYSKQYRGVRYKIIAFQWRSLWKRIVSVFWIEK